MRLCDLLVESRRRDAWQRFATAGLGLHAERAADGSLARRDDEHARRIVVHP